MLYKYYDNIFFLPWLTYEEELTLLVEDPNSDYLVNILFLYANANNNQNRNNFITWKVTADA